MTNQNSIHEEIKCILKAGNICYYSVQTLLSSRFPSNYLKIKIYKIIILPIVLYGCETWSPMSTLREECKLRVFENRILRQIFGPKNNENSGRRRLYSEEGLQVEIWLDLMGTYPPLVALSHGFGVTDFGIIK